MIKNEDFFLGSGGFQISGSSFVGPHDEDFVYIGLYWKPAPIFIEATNVLSLEVVTLPLWLLIYRSAWTEFYTTCVPIIVMVIEVHVPSHIIRKC